MRRRGLEPATRLVAARHRAGRASRGGGAPSWRLGAPVHRIERLRWPTACRSCSSRPTCRPSASRACWTWTSSAARCTTSSPDATACRLGADARDDRAGPPAAPRGAAPRGQAAGRPALLLEGITYTGQRRSRSSTPGRYVPGRPLASSTSSRVGSRDASPRRRGLSRRAPSRRGSGGRRATEGGMRRSNRSRGSLAGARDARRSSRASGGSSPSAAPRRRNAGRQREPGRRPGAGACADGAPSLDTTPVTITVWDYYGEVTPFKPALAGFADGVPLDHGRLRGPRLGLDATRSSTSASRAGEVPDLATLDMTWIPTLASNGALEDLNAAVAAASSTAQPIADQLRPGRRSRR